MKRSIKLLIILLLLILFAVVAFIVVRGEMKKVNITFTIDRTEMAVFDNAPTAVQIHAFAQGGMLVRDKIEIAYETIGAVDRNHVGAYEITVKAKHMLSENQETFVVNVYDDTAPEIILTKVPGSFTFPNEEYEEQGFIAVDNYDGDITSKVVRVVEGTLVTYDVEDSSGNKAHAERTIIFDDPIDPELTLLGEAEVTLEQYSAYTDAGATAFDNVDGDITELIQVTSNVDVNTIGSYEVLYEVEDAYGNTASVTRKVNIIPRAHIPNSELEEKGKIVYLTFDDGPGAYTDKLLDVLDKYNVKVTFFVVNTGKRDTIKKEFDRGHTVAVHSYTHDYRIYKSEETYFEDFSKMQDLIYDITGEKTNIVRFPGGGSNTVSRKYCEGIMSTLAADMKERGLVYFDWNVSSGDAEAKPISTEQVIRNVTNGIRNHNISVVLQHDIKGFSVDAVESIIVWGLENGYTFLPLDETSFTAHHPIAN